MGVFVNDIKVTNTYMKTEDPSVDTMLDAFNSTLSTILNKHAPLKKIHESKHNHIPGIMRTLKMLVYIAVNVSVCGGILE